MCRCSHCFYLSHRIPYAFFFVNSEITESHLIYFVAIKNFKNKTKIQPNTLTKYVLPLLIPRRDN